jgi:arginase
MVIAMNTVSLIGVPCDTGAARRGAALGPDALRVAGIRQSLARLGLEVEDRGNLAGPEHPGGVVENGYRHLQETALWCRYVHDAVFDTARQNRVPVVMGGDHSIAIGSVAAVARYCAKQAKNLCVLWFDAHADFNTPDTSPSGNIHGMPVSTLAGSGPEALLSIGMTTPVIAESNLYQVAIRSVDEAEKAALARSRINVFDMRSIDELGMRETMHRILQDIENKQAHLHLSFDVDCLDPTVAPGTGTKTPGGLSYREAQLCMEMIHDSGLLGSLDIVEINPTMDHCNQTAELAVELVSSLFGKQILLSS